MQIKNIPPIKAEKSHGRLLFFLKLNNAATILPKPNTTIAMIPGTNQLSKGTFSIHSPGNTENTIFELTIIIPAQIAPKAKNKSKIPNKYILIFTLAIPLNSCMFILHFTLYFSQLYANIYRLSINTYRYTTIIIDSIKNAVN